MARHKIALIGAGQIGGTMALLAGQRELGDVVLVDILEGVAKGKALDLQQTRGVFKCDVNLAGGGTTDYSVIKGADVCIALSKPGPDTIDKAWIKKMAPDPIVFICANPIPEIYPWEAEEGGAKVIATGRSDFPNQVNNSLCFPAIFRGTLDVMATTITDEMCIQSAVELAKCAEDKGLSAKYILPTMDEREVFPRLAERGALAGHAQQAYFADIGTPESLAAFERDVLSGLGI